jgi:ADP-heptose:LPS heptosyltransferase
MVANKVKNVFLRNRSNYGAQITCLPFLFAIKEKNAREELNVIYKENLDYFYNQFKWIDQKTNSESVFSDLKHIKKNQHCISLRPNSFGLRLSFFLKNAHPREGIIKSKTHKKSPLLNSQIKFDANIYRAIQYLKLADKKELTAEFISKKLKAPFIHEASLSNLTLSINESDFNILIMVGGGAGEFKKWGVNNFLSVCESLEKKVNSKIKIHALIGPDEKKEKKLLQDAKKLNPLINIYENISISDISKLTLDCDITIANDCGPSHVSQCLQNGFIGIFDKEKKEWFYKNSLSAYLIPKNDKISDISTESVIKEAFKIINIKYENKFEDITY